MGRHVSYNQGHAALVCFLKKGDASSVVISHEFLHKPQVEFIKCHTIMVILNFALI